MPRKEETAVGEEKIPAWAKVSENEIAAWEAFLAFWAAYPRKTDKPQAWTTWKKLKLGVISGQEVTEYMIRDHDLQFRQMKYIPYPSTYLNQRPWENREAPPADELPFHVEQITEREKRIRERTRELMETEFMGHPSARRQAIREVLRGALRPEDFA